MRNGQQRDYLFGLLIFAGAVLTRFALDQIVPDRLPFVTFFPAVFLAAYYFGLGPGAFVLVLSAVVGTFWADPTGQSAFIFYCSAALLFVLTASIILVLVHQLRTNLARVKQRDEQLVLINRLKHRLKNLFSITNSVCLQTMKSGGTVEEMSEAVSGRIMAIASAQDLLSATATEGANLRALFDALVSPLAPKPSRLQIDGPSTKLPTESTTPMALVLHELATNALKYGAWSQDIGLVKVHWKTEQTTLLFRWREHDGPVLAPSRREGLGSGLIKNSFPGATVRDDLKADGLECEILLPLPTV
jgi:two-component sensor histidine kinase